MSLKDELYNGCLVEDRSGTKLIYLSSARFYDEYYNGNACFLHIDMGTHCMIDAFDDDLRCESGKCFDIMKIYNPEYTGEVIRNRYKIPWTWQRVEKTQQEIEMEKLQVKINELQEQYDKIKRSV